MQLRRAQPSETRVLKDWIAANHYLQSCPPGFVHLYEFIEGKEVIGGMLSYSDPSIGHQGTIYEADMWCPLGLTDEPWGYGWKSRNGRRDQHLSKKMRWFRTP